MIGLQKVIIARYQVVDRADYAGNYLETSGTLMLAYSIMKGTRLHAEQIVKNNGHGVAPLLMAYNELRMRDADR